MKQKVKLLDVVALMQEMPSRELSLGQVGTVVEVLAPDVFEVEFSDNEGRTFAELALKADQLLVLHYEPAIGCTLFKRKVAP
ncbi:MAG: DUF4926 domain-containing protein [Chloroflexi bacterium]|nr:DUF4926 domain-containing protein [Chloroflexota bacterium]